MDAALVQSSVMDIEEGGGMFVRNVVIFPQVNTAFADGFVFSPYA
jgi:hypothetical protein